MCEMNTSISHLCRNWFADFIAFDHSPVIKVCMPMKIGLHTIHQIHSVIRDLQGLGTSLFLCKSWYMYQIMFYCLLFLTTKLSWHMFRRFRSSSLCISFELSSSYYLYILMKYHIHHSIFRYILLGILPTNGGVRGYDPWGVRHSVCQLARTHFVQYQTSKVSPDHL